MKGTPILFELGGASASAREGIGENGQKMVFDRLFEPPPDASQPGKGWGLRETDWFITDAEKMPRPCVPSVHPWDAAHAAFDQALELDLAGEVKAVEPDLLQSWLPDHRPDGGFIRHVDDPHPVDQQGPKYQRGLKFAWHLDAEFTGLRNAWQYVGEAAGRQIVIAHLDTGFDERHRARMPCLAPDAEHRNFVDNTIDAKDRAPQNGSLHDIGHGTGTLGILAAGNVAGLASSSGAIPNGFGALGGAPFAKVVPVRVAESGVCFRTSAIARGIDYAREIGADVLSMSLGGMPSAVLAATVNAAYEAGVVMVCAAGDSIGGMPTSLILYPARFDRVIAVCGVMASGNPYYGLGGLMEGNAGPAAAMKTAIAAYTPNIPWLRFGSDIVDMSGRGTSAATPQVASAAALWLAKHKDSFPERNWRRVEAVRAALFESAAKPTGELPPGVETQHRYFGMGTLRARKALDIVRTECPESKPASPESRPACASFAFLKLITGVFDTTAPDRRRQEMFRLELTQLALNSRGAREAVPDPSLSYEVTPNEEAENGQPVPHRRISVRARRRFLEAILDEAKSSQKLRGYLESALGHSITGRGMDVRATANVAGQASSGGPGVRRKLQVMTPTRRRLRVFATDPGDSAELKTAFINIATIEVPWERLDLGPVGEYLEVVDVDPGSGCVYAPADLEDSSVLAQDGYAPSEGNPQFHQQMVYAVAMRTIRNFEIALGRRALWAGHRRPRDEGDFVPTPDGGYVQRLRIYPHALREQNAYYSPDRKALLFGYFDQPSKIAALRRRTIFTCLSHDIVAHETTHALLDGLHRRFREPTNVDVLAFHEAFADIVAIFQHFTFPELLRFEISRMRGDLFQASVLSDLARQFGRALHNERALRVAIPPSENEKDAAGKAPAPSAQTDDAEDDRPQTQYEKIKEAHALGALLVAAIFEAFVAVYKRRTADLFRLASGGTGVLTPGAIHPDLVHRLAEAAVQTAQHVLTTAIRALDYMPPVDPTFGDYLRAIITADMNSNAEHGVGFRVALVEAFARRGIYPADIASVAPDTLLWQAPYGEVQSTRFKTFIQKLDLGTYIQKDRRASFQKAKENAAALHKWMSANLDRDMARAIGLDFDLLDKKGKPHFEVHSVRPALRTTEDGENRIDVVAVVTQWRNVPVRKDDKSGPTFKFRGGTTLLLDRDNGTDPIRYAISKPVWKEDREEKIREFSYPGDSLGMAEVYGDEAADASVERFSALHATVRA